MGLINLAKRDKDTFVNIFHALSSKAAIIEMCFLVSGTNNRARQ